VRREAKPGPGAVRLRGHLIGGAEQRSASGQTFDTIDPSTARPIASMALGDAQDVDRAVKAARAAQPEWERVDPTDRTRLLLRMADLIERDIVRSAVP
jgi:acyl-CoA reductase-like NAD-dependent aldehyde dehydrogenase